MKEEPEWIHKVKATAEFHRVKLKENPKWRVKDTAKGLNKSVGAVSEELKAASWLKTHYSQLIEFEYFYEAIEFIRSKQHHLLTED